MQFAKYLNMNKTQLQEEIDKTEAKIRNYKEQVRLLRRLQESAKGDSPKPVNHQKGETNNGINGKV